MEEEEKYMCDMQWRGRKKQRDREREKRRWGRETERNKWDEM